MSLLSLIAVFLIEQFKPLDYRRVVAEPLGAWADYLELHFNAGSWHHGLMAWLVGVALPVMLLGIAYFVLWAISPLLALALNIVVLYLTMGFRQFSRHYTEIQQALSNGELEEARRLLGEWQGISTRHLGSGDIARLSIEGALIASHRHVFAVLLWFVLLPGPCGALLYRLSLVVRDRWHAALGRQAEFPKFAWQAFGVLDWVPLRATAFAFAIVGDFEDAIYCWRTQADQWLDRGAGIVLAAGAGALGVLLGNPVVDGVDISDRPELGTGEPADYEFMQSAVGLVWRATVLWMLLLFLLGLASLVG